MENFNDLKPDLLSADGLQVDEESGNHLKDAGRWAKTIAVIASILGGLVSLIFLAFSGTFSRSIGFGLQGYVGVVVAMVLIIMGIALIGVINLFRFSSGMAAGINNQDISAFDKGISGLKNYFILIGIFTLLATLIAVVQLIN